MEPNQVSQLAYDISWPCVLAMHVDLAANFLCKLVESGRSAYPSLQTPCISVQDICVIRCRGIFCLQYLVVSWLQNEPTRLL